MTARTKFKSVHWMFVTVLAFAPTAVLAEQGGASRGRNRQDQSQLETAEREAEEPESQVEEASAETEEGELISVPGGTALGMSILGNQEAPTSLVIVPWKSSELGDTVGISTMLDDSRQPVDKEVFMRALRYYQIRSETRP